MLNSEWKTAGVQQIKEGGSAQTSFPFNDVVNELQSFILQLDVMEESNIMTVCLICIYNDLDVY